MACEALGRALPRVFPRKASRAMWRYLLEAATISDVAYNTLSGEKGGKGEGVRAEERGHTRREEEWGLFCRFCHSVQRG